LPFFVESLGKHAPVIHESFTSHASENRKIQLAFIVKETYLVQTIFAHMSTRLVR